MEATAMNKITITENQIANFTNYLFENEKSRATIQKYQHDIRHFVDFCGGVGITKDAVLFYKEKLAEKYALTSANSMLAALNTFFGFLGHKELCVKPFKVQKQTYLSADKELTKAEYWRLVTTAESENNERLSLMIQTICGSGIRVSELKHITVEAVRCGKAEVRCKGKIRVVFIVKELRRKLQRYVKRWGIQSGSVFVTKTGKPVNRTNIWREMKRLCDRANVNPAKVFPHNLRHLFARVFYKIEKDIAKLADILGHSSINTTRIYIMTTGAEHLKRMESMRLIV